MAQSPGLTAAARVRELRSRRRLTVEGLAAEMTKAGIPWGPETVTEFEDGQRQCLDVEELLALAVVLSVPPVALLTDSRVPTVAVTPQVEVPTAYGLLWMLGEQPLHGMTGSWTAETLAIRVTRRFHDAMCTAEKAHGTLATIERLAREGHLDFSTAESRRSDQERVLLHALAELCNAVHDMRTNGIAIPRLVNQELLVNLARGRGLTLDVGSERSPETARRRLTSAQ